MPFISTNQAAQVAIRYRSLSGGNATNVLNFRDDRDDPDAIRLAELCDLVATWLGTSWADHACAHWAAYEVSAKSLLNATPPYHVETVDIAGTAAGQGLPDDCTWAITLRTAKLGRSYRGRMFYVGLSESQSNGSDLDAGAAAAIIGDVEALQSVCFAQDFFLSILSFTENGVPRAYGEMTPVVSIGYSDLIIDRMKTRKPRTT